MHADLEAWKPGPGIRLRIHFRFKYYDSSSRVPGGGMGGWRGGGGRGMRGERRDQTHQRAAVFTPARRARPRLSSDWTRANLMVRAER